MKKIILLTLFILIDILTLKAQSTVLLDFNGVVNGQYPAGGLFSDGTFMYGVTRGGGTSTYCGSTGCGVLFKIKPDGTGYSKLLDFNNSLNGGWPYGTPISDGTFLYGMTSLGGANSNGTIYKIKTDGTGYTKLFDFLTATSGFNPTGSLFFDGTFLYGTTEGGGLNNYGTIFKIKTDGTGYTKLLDFAGVSNGNNPKGSLISDGTFLYGMTYSGGANGLGVIFKIMPDGSGYTTLLDFAGATNGQNPFCSLISDGNFLYGLTRYGGTNNKGTIFKIKTDGTSFSKLYDFTGVVDGQNPLGDLVSDGTFLYGMTQNGGANSYGVIFKILPNGSGFTNLLDFNFLNGRTPAGTLSSYSNTLYGMTEYGGANGFGVIFRYDFVTDVAKNKKEDSFNIYPNPCEGKFTITTSENDLSIDVFNLLGEIIYQSEIKGKKIEFDLSNHKRGIYFARISDGKKVHTEKIIVQ